MEAVATAARERKPQKSNSLEFRREAWLKQLMADPDLQFSHLKIANVIGWHMNRQRGGKAWPGMRRIAKIAHIDPRTVMRGVGWLEKRGHLIVTRDRRGLRNLPNCYEPVIRGLASLAPHLGAQLCHHPRGTAMSPEPYTEPSIEPHIPINIGCVGDAVAFKKVDFRESKKEQKPPSIESQCFQLARAHYGERGASLAAKALSLANPEEVIAEIEAAIEAGEDNLGAALWQFFRS